MVRAAILLIACLSLGQSGKHKPDVSFEPAKLAEIPKGDNAVNFFFSPDGRSVAWVAGGQSAVKQSFVLNGKKEAEVYRGIGPIVWSANGKVVVYRADIETVPSRPPKHIVVVGGKPGPPMQDVDNLRVSADGKIVAWEATDRGSAVAVVNNRKGKPYNSIDDFELSSRGMLAYTCWLGNISVLVMGQKEIKNHRSVRTPGWSPDGKTLSYVVRNTEDKWAMAVSGLVGEAYGRVSPAFWDAKGRKFAYVATRRMLDAGSEFLVVADKPGEEYDQIGLPDGSQLRERTRGVVFSPNGKTVAFAAKTGSKWSVVVGKKKGPEFDLVGTPVWDDKGRNVAYPVKKGAQWSVFVDGQLHGPYDSVEHVMFHKDGKRVAFVAWENQRARLIVGNRKSDPVDGLWSPVFSRDGKKIAYGARVGRELWWKVMGLE